MPYEPSLGTRPEDLGVNVFSPVGTGGSQVEYTNVYDYPLPEFTTKFTRHVKYFGFSTLLKSMGNSRGKDTPTTGHYEEPWAEDLFNVDTIESAAGGAGNNMTVAITAGSMFDTSVTANSVAIQTSYPIVGDIIETFDGVQAQIVSKDTSATPHEFVLTPLDSTVDLDASVNPAESYHIVTHYSAEGSGLPATRAPRVIKWNNTFAIVKAAYSSTGSEWTNRVRFEVKPGVTDSVNVFVEESTLYHYERARDGVLLFGQQADNLIQFVSEINIDAPIVGTEGFLQFARLGGTTDTYTGGSYGLADLDVIGNIMEDERATTGSDLLALDGTDVYSETEDALVAILDGNLAPFVNRLVPGYTDYYKETFAAKDEGVDWGVNIGFFSVRKRGFNFIMKKLPVLSDIRRAGTSDYKYRGTRVVCPLDYAMNMKGGERVPMMGYEYKSLNGYSRETVIGQIAGIGVANTGRFPMAPSHQFDTHQMGLVCEIAGHWACGNKIVYQEAA